MDISIKPRNLWKVSSKSWMKMLFRVFWGETISIRFVNDFRYFMVEVRADNETKIRVFSSSKCLAIFIFNRFLFTRWQSLCKTEIANYRYLISYMQLFFRYNNSGIAKLLMTDLCRRTLINIIKLVIFYSILTKFCCPSFNFCLN